MEIRDVQVYGLDESVIASGFPMKTEGFSVEMPVTNSDIKRAVKLGNTNSIEGHACYLKGVIVQATIKAPQHFWLQWERYHYQDTISSQGRAA